MLPCGRERRKTANFQTTNMNRDGKFWVSMVVFQIFFGLAIFALTRAYYLQNAASAIAQPAAAAAPAAAPPQGSITDAARSLLSHSGSLPSEPASQDPAEISRQAAQFFANQQYSQALDSYQKLLALSPNNVDLLNELGLTLQYLGRSDEALSKLKQGVAIDPTHQRIRLTLGFVNSQLGNIKEAREALTAATQLGTDENVRQSAKDMLAKLPR
jgi:tetratricopeptide (TPR) repeat protein